MEARKLTFKLKEGRWYLVNQGRETLLPERLKTPDDLRKFYGLSEDRAEFIGENQQPTARGKFVSVSDYDGMNVTFKDIDGKEQKEYYPDRTSKELKKLMAGKYPGAEIILPEAFKNPVDEGNNDCVVLLDKNGYPEAVTVNGSPIDAFPYSPDQKKISNFLKEQATGQNKSATVEFITLP